MTVAQEAAARGAAWLDERKPDWYRDIDVAELDLSDGCRCVLGQIGGDYSDALGWLFEGNDWVGKDRDADVWAWHLGFNALGEEGAFNQHYAALDEAWIAEIKARWESTDG